MDAPKPAPCDHIVQFYDVETELIDRLAAYVIEGLAAGERSVVIATHAHLTALEERINAEGRDVPSARRQGLYLPLNAAETLSKFMLDGRPDRGRFFAAMDPIIRPAAVGNRPLRAFGEMVAILWAEGNATAAIELEGMWNELIAREKFSLLCAYPMPRFRRESARGMYAHVCALHTQLIPALA